MGPVSTATKQSMMNARIQLFLLVTQSGTSACGMVPPPFRVGLCTSIHIIYTQKFVCTLILTLINLIKLTSQSLKQPGRTQHSASFIGPATFCGCLTTDLKDLPLPWATMAPRLPLSRHSCGPFTVELLNPPSGSIVLSLSLSSHQRTRKDRSKKILE